MESIMYNYYMAANIIKVIIINSLYNSLLITSNNMCVKFSDAFRTKSV